MKKAAFITVAILLPGAQIAIADDPVIPPDPPSVKQYEQLWTKSPFAVATPDEGSVPDSPDYALVGVTQFDDVSYASIVQKQNSDHFLISSDKENRGMLLKSITHSTTGSDTFATVEKDGQELTLKLESAPIAPPGANGMPGAPPPSMTPMVQNIQMPGSQPLAPPPGPSTRFRIRRPPIHLPPQPSTIQPGSMLPPGATPTGINNQAAQSVQPHFPPPSQ